MAEYGVTFSHSSPHTGGMVATAGWYLSRPGDASRPFDGWQDAFLYARSVAAAQPGVGFEVVKREHGGEWRHANGRGELAPTLSALRQARGWV